MQQRKKYFNQTKTKKKGNSLVSFDVLKSMCLITLSYQVRLLFFIIANDDSKTNARFTT